MAKIVTAILARIEAIGKLKESSYQPNSYYRSVLFVDVNEPDPEKAKLWKSLSESECQGLAKGSMVQLVPRGMTKEGVPQHNIVLMDDKPPVVAPTSTPAPQASGWSPDEKRALATLVQQHSDLLRYCLETSRTKFDGLVTEEESFRCLATTLFLSALRESR